MCIGIWIYIYIYIYTCVCVFAKEGGMTLISKLRDISCHEYATILIVKLRLNPVSGVSSPLDEIRAGRPSFKSYVYCIENN